MTKLIPKIKISNRLSELRSQNSITQQALAEAIGVTRATIIAIEKGDYNPSLELVFRLAKFFKTDLQSIFFETEDSI